MTCERNEVCERKVRGGDFLRKLRFFRRTTRLRLPGPGQRLPVSSALTAHERANSRRCCHGSGRSRGRCWYCHSSGVDSAQLPFQAHPRE